MTSVFSKAWRVPIAAGVLLGLTLAAMPTTPTAAQGTPAQRAACEQDAFRLCSEFIPDEGRTASCLRRNLLRLSPPCRALLSGKGKGKSPRK